MAVEAYGQPQWVSDKKRAKRSAELDYPISLMPSAQQIWRCQQAWVQP